MKIVQNILTIAVPIIFWLLGIIWTRKDLFNFLLKILLLAYAILTTISLLYNYGYIVKY